MTTAREVILRSWRGPTLPADGSWVRMAPWRADLYAVLSVNAHRATMYRTIDRSEEDEGGSR